MSLQNAQSHYLEETITAASPARLVTLLFDRLGRDLARAQPPMSHGRFDEAESLIDHAREILVELLSTLDGSAWDGAVDLARIYTWMLSELITARVRRDLTIVASVHKLVVEIGRGWHEAADSVEQKVSVPA